MQIPNVIGNYAIGEKIGEGNYAEVKLATHCLLKQKVALKIINKSALSQNDVDKINREVKIMKVLHHPNIIRLYQVMRDSSDRLYMVTEYAPGGELYSYLVKFRCMEESQARNIFSQLLSALEFCHSRNVVHRDIKLENLLLDSNGNVKLADFGFSNFFSWDGKLSTWCGSPSYAAPEIFEGREYIGPEVDIWSAGVVLYTLVSGCLPFDGANVQELKQRVIKKIYRIHFRISEECRDIISKMIVYEPSKRHSIPKLREHSWMQKIKQQSPIVKPQGADDINKVREYVIRNLKANGVDWQSVLEAANQRKFDDWYAMYCILEDQYFKEVKTASNIPPTLPSETRALPSSIWFPELQQQSETLRQARDWTCRDLAKVPLSLSSKSSFGSSQMEPAQRLRTISGQHDTQLALHQQYLNYRRHSLDIFTFQNPHIRNHLTSSNLSTTNDLLRTPLNNFTSDLAARRASDSIALHSNRVMTEQSIPPPSFMFYQEMCKPDHQKKTVEEPGERFLSSIPPRVKNHLSRRASDGHITFNKTPNLDSLQELPGQEHDSEEMLPIPSSFQLSPRQQPRRHSFEPSILLPHMGSSAKSVTLQQHLESLYEQALYKNQTEESETSSESETMNTDYNFQQRNLGSRLQDLHIESNNVEQWRHKNSHYMNCVENMEDMPIDTNIAEEEVRLPRQVSTANIISDQSARDILNFVESYFMNVSPTPCLNTDGFAIRASWTELEIFAEVCSVGCRSGVQLQHIRGDHSYYAEVSRKLISSLSAAR